MAQASQHHPAGRRGSPSAVQLLQLRFSFMALLLLELRWRLHLTFIRDRDLAGSSEWGMWISVAAEMRELGDGGDSSTKLGPDSAWWTDWGKKDDAIALRAWNTEGRCHGHSEWCGWSWCVAGNKAS